MSKRLFGTDGIRGVAGEPPLDAPTVRRFGAALAETAGHQNAVHVAQLFDGIVVLENLRFDPIEVHPRIIGDAAVR